MTKKTEKIENPFVDSVYNDKWADIKVATEKTIADKVHNRIKERKEEIIDDILER